MIENPSWRQWLSRKFRFFNHAKYVYNYVQEKWCDAYTYIYITLKRFRLMIMENQSRTKQGRRRIKNTEIKTDIFKVYKRKKKLMYVNTNRRHITSYTSHVCLNIYIVRFEKLYLCLEVMIMNNL